MSQPNWADESEALWYISDDDVKAIDNIIGLSLMAENKTLDTSSTTLTISSGQDRDLRIRKAINKKWVP